MRELGKLQRIGAKYAKDLMLNYSNEGCCQAIEAWKTRKTSKYDWDKIKQNYPYLNTRQAKQVVNYAKEHINSLISEYLADKNR